MLTNYVFLPQPRACEIQPGEFSFDPQGVVLTEMSSIYSAHQILTDIKGYYGFDWHVTATQPNGDGPSKIQLILDPDLQTHPQGYQLSITPHQILIKGSDAAGLFYGVQTLRQMIFQSPGKKLPCMEIKDWPDFLNRGVMLDISRDKVYRMDTLKMLIDEFASWKFNQLQLYTEHTFAYAGHETVWKDASPITPEEIKELDQYCQERFIELVPNQNSFGHMSRWLVHSEYQHLAETTQPVKTPWNTIQVEPYSLSPVLPQSLEFVNSLYDQLLPNFSSKMVNVGCDETFDVGAGWSKEAVEQKGVGQVYLNYLLALYHSLKQRGYTMQFWGDIVLQHPELIPQLPKDAIALNWGYEADHPFESETKHFQEANVPYYVCPGTSSWNSIAGRTDNMINNIRNGAYFGLKYGAIGFIITDWGDNGHWQQLPISYPGFAFAAQQAWFGEVNSIDSLASVLNRIVFRDSSERIGEILLDLGKLYQAWGVIIHNSSPLFWLLQLPQDQIKAHQTVGAETIKTTLAYLDETKKQLVNLNLKRPDAELIIDELSLTIQLLELACKRALMLMEPEKGNQNTSLLHEVNEIIAEFSRLWLLRNRPGGLADSIQHFQIIREGNNIETE